MSKGIVTEYPEICIFCGRQAEAEHHLIFGTAGRELSEKDGLKIPVCNNCHNMGQKLCRIHENPMAEKLSKMLGPVSYTHLSPEKNPLHAWSEMEADAFWSMFKEYENAKGNGHMHTVVQPEMRALEVIPMHEDAKIAELMGSRK